MPGIKPKKLAATEAGFVVEGGRATELAIVVSLPGDRFDDADADQKGGGNREQNGPGVERDASIGSGCCHMEGSKGPE
jgi:hypothetical protein